MAVIKLSKKFLELFEIYSELKGSNRKERYNIAEVVYQERNREKAYDDFRKFSALLSMHYNSSVPHNSSVKGYVKKK